MVLTHSHLSPLTMTEAFVDSARLRLSFKSDRLLHKSSLNKEKKKKKERMKDRKKEVVNE